MNPTNFKLALGATVTGLLMIAAGGLTGISPVAADGPDIQHPGELAASMVPANAAAYATDLTAAAGAGSHVNDCTLGAETDEIINPTVNCAAPVTGGVRPNADQDAMRLISFSNTPPVDGVLTTSVAGAQDGAATSVAAIQAEFVSR